MMRMFERPSARAERTYSKFRARKNSARTTPTNAVQAKTVRIRSKVRKLGAKKADMMMIR